MVRFMRHWFCRFHRSSDLKCPLSGAISLMLCDVLNNVPSELHLNLPDSMNKSECDVKPQFQACCFSLFSLILDLSSFNSFIVSHVFDRIHTQGFHILKVH